MTNITKRSILINTSELACIITVKIEKTDLTMEKLVIEATPHSPRVEFNPDGRLKLEGRSFPEDASKFYDELIDYVSELEVHSAILVVNLEYINTASSKKLLDLFRQLDSNENISDVLVNWHYEEGDDDSLETAEIFEESLDRIKFVYSEYAEVNVA
jgi:hypothetical protein